MNVPLITAVLHCLLHPRARERDSNRHWSRRCRLLGFRQLLQRSGRCLADGSSMLPPRRCFGHSSLGCYSFRSGGVSSADTNDGMFAVRDGDHQSCPTALASTAGSVVENRRCSTCSRASSFAASMLSRCCVMTWCFAKMKTSAEILQDCAWKPFSSGRSSTTSDAAAKPDTYDIVA